MLRLMSSSRLHSRDGDTRDPRIDTLLHAEQEFVVV